MRALPLIALALTWRATVASAQAPRDYDPASDAWNGLGAFVRAAEAQGAPLERVQRLDVGTLTPEDALVIVAPEAPLPATELTAFLRAGGRIALADDVGRGDSLLDAFRIVRGDPDPSHALSLRGNPALLVARPATGHPLTRGVSALVTNHPRVVFHPDLEPIFAFGERDAVVLAGAVSAGRLVAIGDPSVFIDNMQSLAGNRRFAENLIRYLESAAGGRILLVPPDARIVGRFGEPGADRPLHDVRSILERVASAALPPGALRVGAAALAGLLVVLGAGMLPRRSPYAGASMFATPTLQGGLAGRVGYYAQRPGNLAEPLVVYQEELEHALGRALGLPGRARIDDVITRMTSRGWDREQLTEARALFRALDDVREGLERGHRGDALESARFLRLVEAGDALLARVRSAA